MLNSPVDAVLGDSDVLDKLKKVMNADVGKMLNADVGKVLKTDVGKLLKTDLADLFTDEDAAAEDAPKKVAGTMPSKAADAPKADDDKGPPTVPGDGPNSQMPGQPPQTRLTEDIAVRKDYERPYGQEISNLLPINVGEFSRPPNEPSGTLATDPARAFYSGGGAKLEVEVGSYWDEDEALSRVRALEDKCASSKPSPDGTWMVGKSDKGITFAWLREHYVFAVTSQDAPALIRFLKSFPY